MQKIGWDSGNGLSSQISRSEKNDVLLESLYLCEKFVQFETLKFEHFVRLNILAFLLSSLRVCISLRPQTLAKNRVSKSKLHCKERQFGDLYL